MKREGCIRVEPLPWKVLGAGSSTPRPDTPSGCGKTPSRGHVSAKGRTVCCFASDNVRFFLQSFNVQLWSDVS